MYKTLLPILKLCKSSSISMAICILGGAWMYFRTLLQFSNWREVKTRNLYFAQLLLEPGSEMTKLSN